MAIKSCGCSDGQKGGEKVNLWEERDVSEDNNFDFGSAHILKSIWCPKHGKEWCENILKLNDE